MNLTTPRRWLAGSLLGLALGGCASSPPTHYYSLLPPPGATAPTATAPSFQFEVLPVDVPAQVDRAEMVVSQGNERTPVDTRQWAAPLGNELQDAFSIALAARLGAHDVYGLPHDDKLPTWRVKIAVQRFDSALGAFARIDASWSLQRAGESASAVCASSVTEPVAAGYDAMATGQQKAVAAIATQIANSLDAAARSGSAVRCPGG